MSDTYSEKAHGWILPSPTPHNLPKQTLKAFIDDVNLFIGKNPTPLNQNFSPKPKKISTGGMVSSVPPVENSIPKSVFGLMSISISTKTEPHTFVNVNRKTHTCSSETPTDL